MEIHVNTYGHLQAVFQRPSWIPCQLTPVHVHSMVQHSKCNSHQHLLATIISVNQQIQRIHMKTQTSFDTQMIHSGMVKSNAVKASAAIALTTAHRLGSVLRYLLPPVKILRYAFVLIKKLTMKMLQLDCLRYMCSD